ncbi:unnamed protein product [Paramecium sonneborni]|uniref:Uncharacterized protein n=1 Tax=Paramecium sonneborni TaxID=65129 RepID=A0A8S1LK85_9CILI|nr:unnamed protein product [Paramecium sonneborni]
MKQEILQDSELEQQLKIDTNEVIKQLQILQKSLSQLSKLIQAPGIERQSESELIQQNQKFLESQLKPIIENFNYKMKEYEEKMNQKLNSKLQEADIQKQYQDFEEQMQQFYECYKIIWGQAFYYLQRKRIILNQDPTKKSLLINKLLS